MPLTGWVMSSARNFPVSWFGLVQLPDLVAPNRPLYETLHTTHDVLAWTLVGRRHAARAGRAQTSFRPEGRRAAKDASIHQNTLRRSPMVGIHAPRSVRARSWRWSLHRLRGSWPRRAPPAHYTARLHAQPAALLVRAGRRQQHRALRQIHRRRQLLARQSRGQQDRCHRSTSPRSTRATRSATTR